MVGFGGIHVGNDDDEYDEVEARRWRGRKAVRGMWSRRCFVESFVNKTLYSYITWFAAAGASWVRFPVLTVGLLGAQIVWSTEMGYGMSYYFIHCPRRSVHGPARRERVAMRCSLMFEIGTASPYLLSLGLSKSAISIVFIAGPLSGLFVQPLIGEL
jgi:solute carrier family 45 protein 1/2/4